MKRFPDPPREGLDDTDGGDDDMQACSKGGFLRDIYHDISG